MSTYRVIEGSYFHEGRLYEVGDTFYDESPALASVFSSLELAPEPEEAQEQPVEIRFEARHVVTNKWGVFCVLTDNLILNRYVSKKRAWVLAERANRGKLLESDKEVNQLAFKEFYGSARNS